MDRYKMDMSKDTLFRGEFEVIKELISSRHGDIQLPGWDKEEIEYIMNTLCTQQAVLLKAQVSFPSNVLIKLKISVLDSVQKYS